MTDKFEIGDTVRCYDNSALQEIEQDGFVIEWWAAQAAFETTYYHYINGVGRGYPTSCLVPARMVLVEDIEQSAVQQKRLYSAFNF